MALSRGDLVYMVRRRARAPAPPCAPAARARAVFTCPTRDASPPPPARHPPAARRRPRPQAKLAEEAERYDDMVVSVKSLAELKEQLNVEVRG